LLARGKDGLEGVCREAEAAGGKALVLPTDVPDAAQVEAAAAAVEETFGPLDIWINNAMVSVFSPVKEMTAEEFRRVTEITYLGYVYGTLAALRRMLPRDEASSFRSARPWLTGVFRFSRPTVGPNTVSRVLPNRSAAS
jgi:NAD(P)-dependent dehydrogenase (short-subunit alcohol dehydrogenase family)